MTCKEKYFHLLVCDRDENHTRQHFDKKRGLWWLKVEAPVLTNRS